MVKICYNIDIFYAVLLIFLSGFFSPGTIIILELIFLIFNKKFKYNKKFIIFIILIIFHSCLNIFLKNDTFILFIKQIVGIFINFIFYYTIIDNKTKVYKSINIYYIFSFYTSILCLFQQISFYINFKYLYDLRWLVKSQLPPSLTFYRSVAFFSEPSQCAIVLIPSVFLSIYYLFGRQKKEILKNLNLSKIKSIIISLALITTFSSIGYIGFILCFAFIFFEYKNKIRKILVLIIMMVIFLGLYSNIDNFKNRVNDTFLLFFKNSIISNSNISSQTLYINFKVSTNSLINSYYIGNGLGSHLISYQKFYNYIDLTGVHLFLNQEDANSLFLRIMSEFGIIGILFVVYFLKKYKPNKDKYISLSCFIVFFIRLIRMGHYFNVGLWYFIILYIQNSNLIRGDQNE